MSGFLARGLFAMLTLVGLTPGSIADDWTAVRLRGEVFVYRDGWVKLERGDIVADDSIIRTLARGRVSFERGAETIDLLPNSQIRIIDQNGRKFTTVMSDYGDIAIEAEVQDVEHFSVATPFLAAVVKGTRFSVSSDGDGSSVSVERGQVLVEDTSSHDSVTIVAGQTVSTSSSPSDEALIVTGIPAGTGPISIDEVPIVTLEGTNSAPVAATHAPTPAGPDSEDSASVDDNDDGKGPGNDNGSPNGQENDDSGAGSNSGNHNGQDNENSGPGNDNGNNGNHNGHIKDDKGNNGNHNGQNK